MPTGVPQATGTVVAGSPAPDTTIDRKCILIGCTSAGSGLTLFQRTSAALVAACGLGDVVDTGCGVIEQLLDSAGAGVKYPVAICTVPATTAGTYGTIDVSGITGTAIATLDTTVVPLGTHEARVLVSTGGTLGTAGIMVRWSRNGGRLYSNPIALGTATGYTVPGGAGRVEFSPTSANLTVLNTLINECFVDHNAHVINVTGTTHTNADTVDVVSAGTYPSATNTATRSARINAVVAAAKLHAIKGSGGTPATHINVGGDTTYLAALNAITTATEDDTALAAAIAFKTAHNLHIVAASAWHTIADASNVVTSPDAAAGTLIADDVVAWRTIAPSPLAADIFDGSTSPPTGALATIGMSGAKAALIAFDFDVDADMAGTISDGLDFCAASDKDVAALIRVRAPDAETSETDTQWSTAVKADFFTFEDYRIVGHAGYGLTKHAVTGAQLQRSTFAQFVTEQVRAGRGVYAGSPAAGPMANTALANSSGSDVGHDEGSRGGGAVLADYEAGNRFSSCFRSARAPKAESVYLTVPFTFYSSTDQIKNLAVLTIVNAAKRVALEAVFLALGGKIAYEPADAAVPGSVPTLPQETRELIQSAAMDALDENFGGEIQNLNDKSLETGIVRVPTICTVSAGNLVTVPASLVVGVFGLLIAVNFSIAVQE
jgi:hypothetical protein